MKLAAALCILAVALRCGAATWPASSPSLTDVSNAVASASDGDTVSVPAGIATWTNTLVIGKAIKLSGAGTNSTVIQHSNTLALHFYGVSSNAGFRLTAFTFTNTAATPAGTYSPVRVTGPLMTFRVDRCRFDNSYVPLLLANRCEGVVDHNIFRNCEISILLSGDSSNSWTRSVSAGTTNCTVIEDNDFVLTSAFPLAAHNQDVYNQDGARSTTRRNTWSHDSYTGVDSYWDSHGDRVGGIVAQPLTELYLNTFSGTNAAEWYEGINTRGGASLIWSNTFNLSTYLNQDYVIKLMEEGTPTKPSYGWHQITNTYIWGNTFRGVAITNANVYIGADKTNGTIQVNRDFFFTNTSASVWNPYTPLTYPHPRVTAEDSSATTTITIGTATVGTIRAP